MKSPVSYLFRKIGSLIVAISFLGTSLYIPQAQAQLAFLPAAGSMVGMTPAFTPMLVKGIKFYKDNPFKFDFIVDRGDADLSQEQIKEQGKKLISYFLASLTTPEKEMWVNLSPFEKSRIIPSSFGQTEMGKVLLSQDYILKQIMATALYPEKEMGREFWQKVYTEAASRFGTTDVPISTYNKVWIVPDKAVVYENSLTNSVFVVESSLKVMLEQDYLAANKNKAREQYGITDISDRQHANAVSALSSQIIKEIVIPALEREVNYGKNFASLRQVYQSLILAAWYKKNLKDNVLAKGYVDRNKVMGINVQDKNVIQKIYNQYLRAYRKGVYNYIKEEIDPTTQQMIPRKYFSGGFSAAMLVLENASPAQIAKSNETMLSRASQKLGSVLMMGVTFMMTILPVGHHIKLINGMNIVSLDQQGTEAAEKTNIEPAYNLGAPVQLAGASNVSVTPQIKAAPASNVSVTPGVNKEMSVVKDVQLSVAGINNTYNSIAPLYYNNVKNLLEALTLTMFNDDSNNSSGTGGPGICGFVPCINGVPFKNAYQPGISQRLNIILTNQNFTPQFKKVTPSMPSAAMTSMPSAITLPANHTAVPTLDPRIKLKPPVSLQFRLKKASTVRSNRQSTTVPLPSQASNPSNPSQVGFGGINKNGGIDLEKINLLSRREGKGVITAFSDPRVLEMLKKADGLQPVIYDIHPMTLPMMNVLLGLNVPIKTNNPANEPTREADTKIFNHSLAFINKEQNLLSV